MILEFNKNYILHALVIQISTDFCACINMIVYTFPIYTHNNPQFPIVFNNVACEHNMRQLCLLILKFPITIPRLQCVLSLF